MNRIATGLTAEAFYAGLPVEDQPVEPPMTKHRVTYRCKHVIYVHKSDWEGACGKNTPTSTCDCQRGEDA